MDHILPYVLFLACPVSMGAMMWFMMRGNPADVRAKEDLERRVRELEAERNSSHGQPERTPEFAGPTR